MFYCTVSEGRVKFGHGRVWDKVKACLRDPKMRSRHRIEFLKRHILTGIVSLSLMLLSKWTFCIKIYGFIYFQGKLSQSFVNYPNFENIYA